MCPRNIGGADEHIYYEGGNKGVPVELFPDSMLSLTNANVADLFRLRSSPWKSSSWKHVVAQQAGQSRSSDMLEGKCTNYTR